jgi:hypothetical protein
MKICICGGGNLGHVVAGFIAAQGEHEVSILTRHPEQWCHQLQVEIPEQTVLLGNVNNIFAVAKDAVCQAELILLCLPGFAIREALMQIRDYIQPEAAVGSVVSSTGFFFEAMELLPKTITLFGFQRVPFISRIIEYGHCARLLGYKDKLSVAIEHSEDPERLRQHLESLFKTPTHLLDSFYEASLSNSNPLLHPSRLYDLWSDWQESAVYNRVPFFYEEWTERAAQLYMEMDAELQKLLAVLPVRRGSIPTVLDYYESTDAVSLTHKLRSIEAFKGIKAPMKETGNGFVPDFHSRYFTEDFPYGLAIIRRQAQEKGIATPTIDRVMEWGLSVMNVNSTNNSASCKLC